MYYISAVFAYDFRRLPTSLQEASFYSVLQDERTQFETVTINMPLKITPSACGFYYYLFFCTLYNPFFNTFYYPVSFNRHILITIENAEHISTIAKVVVVPDKC